jgi:hypothetical protein
LVLLAGDGDFFDMIDFIKEDYGIKIFVACWKQSINEKMKKKVD